ncbi:MAG: roadblock/LC7 domain-containing protein [Thermodesulfobacteriota bacterium]|nr:roadblock/LC7 domain-containing protein [Thermodesulfobacteriota bacterium]
MNIIITKEDLEKINFFLNKVVSSSLAHSVLLIDRSGQLIAHYGNTLDIDVLSLSALTAANFGATAEIAKILGEEEFSLLFHKGKSENVYFTAIGEHVIMVALFDDNTSLGLIRLRINQIVGELSKLFYSIFEEKREISVMRPHRHQ